jgi:hypothetical protein
MPYIKKEKPKRTEIKCTVCFKQMTDQEVRNTGTNEFICINCLMKKRNEKYRTI